MPKELDEFEQEIQRINDEYQRDKKEKEAAVASEGLGAQRGPTEFTSVMGQFMNLNEKSLWDLPARWIESENAFFLKGSEARFAYFTAGGDGQPQARIIVSRLRGQSPPALTLILRPRVDGQGRFYWISSLKDREELSTAAVGALVLRALFNLERPQTTNHPL